MALILVTFSLNKYNIFGKFQDYWPLRFSFHEHGVADSVRHFSFRKLPFCLNLWPIIKKFMSNRLANTFSYQR